MKKVINMKRVFYILFAQNQDDYVSTEYISKYNDAKKNKNRISTLIESFQEKIFLPILNEEIEILTGSSYDVVIRFRSHSTNKDKFIGFQMTSSEIKLFSDHLDEFHENSYYGLLVGFFYDLMFMKNQELDDLMQYFSSFLVSHAIQDLSISSLDSNSHFSNELAKTFVLHDNIYRTLKDKVFEIYEDVGLAQSYVDGKLRLFKDTVKETTVSEIPELEPISCSHSNSDQVVAFSNDWILTKEVAMMIQVLQKNPISSLKNIALYGSTSTGKSLACSMVAHYLGLPKMTLSMNVETDLTQLLGREVLEEGKTFFKRSKFIDYVENGGVIELAEINHARADELIVLNALMEKDGGIVLQDGSFVKRHKNCIIIGTYNVGYAGCKPLNLSLKRRFGLKISMSEFTDEQLKEMMFRQSDFDDETILDKMIRFYRDCKVTIEDEMISSDLSITELINWVNTYQVVQDISVAAEMTILPSISDDKEISDSFKAKMVGVFY